MIDAFHDVLFPTTIAYGARGGPSWRTDVVSFQSGHEHRTARWAGSRRRYDAGFGIRSKSDIALVLAFFEARQGRRFAFRWRDPFDSTSSPSGAEPSPLDQLLGTADGIQMSFLLCKAYEVGSEGHIRSIALPVMSEVTVAVDGVRLDSTGYVVTQLPGEVQLLVPPPPGAVVSAGFRFDVPARFDTDELLLSLQVGGASVPSVPIVEVLS